jgi:hypothetical protein
VIIVTTTVFGNSIYLTIITDNYVLLGFTVTYIQIHKNNYNYLNILLQVLGTNFINDEPQYALNKIILEIDKHPGQVLQVLEKKLTLRWASQK